MDTKLVSLYKNISIFAFVLMQPCLFIDESILALGLSLPMERFLLLGNLLAIAFFSHRTFSLNRLQCKIVIYFVVIICYLFVIDVLFYQGTEYTTRGTIRKFITAILILIIINDRKFNIVRLYNFFVYVAFVFSLLSVIQYIGYVTGVINLSNYSFKTYSVGWDTLKGFGGFTEYGYMFGKFYRNQSYWIEPARFAQFLMIPLFLSLNKYQKLKSKKNIFVFMIIVLAFILTFSVANYFGLLIGLIIYFLFFQHKGKISLKPFYRIMIFISVFFILFLGYSLYNISNTYGYYQYSGNILGKFTSESVETRVGRFQIASSVLDKNVFGNALLTKSYKSNPTAIGMLIIYGGIPLAVLCLLFAGTFYLSLYRFLKRSKNMFIYISSIAYFIPFNWYGSYYENVFLFQIVFFTALMRYELKNKKLFKGTNLLKK